MIAGTTLNFHRNTSLIDHLIGLPLDFFEKRHVGDIISRFGSLSVIGKSVTTDLVRALLGQRIQMSGCLVLNVPPRGRPRDVA
jgi:ATP-binding cassette, subfamily B, bacterial CvaB/MchF/RaxB